jgi:hypothetical protein
MTGEVTMRDKSALIRLVEALGGSEYRAAAANMRELLEWLESHPDPRPWLDAVTTLHECCLISEKQAANLRHQIELWTSGRGRSQKLPAARRGTRQGMSDSNSILDYMLLVAYARRELPDELTRYVRDRLLVDEPFRAAHRAVRHELGESLFARPSMRGADGQSLPSYNQATLTDSEALRDTRRKVRGWIFALQLGMMGKAERLDFCQLFESDKVFRRMAIPCLMKSDLAQALLPMFVQDFPELREEVEETFKIPIHEICLAESPNLTDGAIEQLNRAWATPMERYGLPAIDWRSWDVVHVPIH